MFYARKNTKKSNLVNVALYTYCLGCLQLYDNQDDVLNDENNYPDDTSLHFLQYYFGTYYPENNKKLYKETLNRAKDKYIAIMFRI